MERCRYCDDPRCVRFWHLLRRRLTTRSTWTDPENVIIAVAVALLTLGVQGRVSKTAWSITILAVIFIYGFMVGGRDRS